LRLSSARAPGTAAQRLAARATPRTARDRVARPRDKGRPRPARRRDPRSRASSRSARQQRMPSGQEASLVRFAVAQGVGPPWPGAIGARFRTDSHLVVELQGATTDAPARPRDAGPDLRVVLLEGASGPDLGDVGLVRCLLEPVGG